MPPSAGARPYRVELTPHAWKQVGSLPGHAFAKVRVALESLAERIPAEAPHSAAEDRLLEAGGYRILYSVDLREAAIVVRAILQEVPMGG